VKLNIDKNEELTEMLNISSVPTVFLVYKGNLVDSFVGMPDQKKLDFFFESITLLGGIGQDEKIIQSLIAAGDEHMRRKQYEQAENVFKEGLTHPKWKDKYYHILKLGLALCAFNRADYTTAEKICKELKTIYKSQIDADPHLAKKFSLLEMKLMIINNPELSQKENEDLLKQIEENPKDLTIRYKLAVHNFETGDYEKAMETLLEIIQIERNWNDKLANKTLLHIFNFLGPTNNSTIEGRKRLTKILY